MYMFMYTCNNIGQVTGSHCNGIHSTVNHNYSTPAVPIKALGAAPALMLSGSHLQKILKIFAGLNCGLGVTPRLVCGWSGAG